MAAPAALAIVARLATGPRAIDDAYITFRYARNLAEGLGLVYNPGEWVLGTTTPLWAVLLAGLYRLGAVDLPLAAVALAATFDAASAALLAHLALRLGWSRLGAAVVGVAWALNPLSIAFATGGMESSLFVLVTLASLSLAGARRSVATSALAGGAILVRPEAGLLAAVVVGWACWERRRLALGPLLAAALPLLAAAGALAALYGSPVPQSVIAKQVVYRQDAPLANLLVLALQAGLPGWWPGMIAALGAVGSVGMAAVGLALLGILLHAASRTVLQRGDLCWQPFAAFGLAYLTFYVAAGAREVPLFPWYLAPLAPLYLLAWSAGLPALGTSYPGVPRGAQHPHPLPDGRASEGNAPLTQGEGYPGPAHSAGPRGTRGARAHHSWLAAALLVWQVVALDWRQPFSPLGTDRTRERAYEGIGRQLARELPPGAVVAAPEIGALGYASGLRILDTVGLVSPEALRYYPLPAEQLVSNNGVPARLVEERQPDAVVALDEFARLSLLPDPAFQRDYALVRAVPAPIWQSQAVLVFRRVEAPR